MGKRIFFKRQAKRQAGLFDVLFRIKEIQQPTHDEAMALMVDVVKAIRPKTKYSKRFAESQLVLLVERLTGDDLLREKFKHIISQLFVNTELVEIMVGCGLDDEGSFWGEVSKRIKHKILPPLQNTGSFTYVINTVFYKSGDYKWVSAIASATWIRFFGLLGIEINLADKKMYDQLMVALRTLSNRVAVLGVDKTVTEKLGAAKKNFNAFVEQGNYLSSIRESMVALGSYRPDRQQLEGFLKQLEACKGEINLARRKALIYGVGLKETYNFIRLAKMLDRMELIIDLIDGDELLDLSRFVGYFKSVVEYENTKYKLGAYMSQSVELVAYRIAEHEQSTGEHYITSDKKEYKEMLRSAMGGGFIISFIAIFKNILHHFTIAPFWQSFLYSVNYALGFILIQVTGSTLATKQPAMTASAIAKSMTNKRFGNENMAELAITVSKVMRSQTASFVGNLAIVFPLTLGLAALFHIVFGFKLAEGAAAQGLLDQQNPLKSLSILYACYTGVFLFLSGIISGFFDNKVIYAKIPERIKAHPTLKRIVPAKTLNKTADYIGRNLGMLTGNICLGFFLGFAYFFGYIFGLPFDIRHITISTGNFAIGLYGLGTNVSSADVIWTSVGVILIGVFNFLVSFFLAFYIAVRSRGIKLKQYPKFLKYIRILFFRYPLDFIYPPKKERAVADIIEVKKA